MKRQPRILAGSAIALLMASAPLGALPLDGLARPAADAAARLPLMRVQADCPEGETCAPAPEQASPDEDQPEQKPRRKRRSDEQQDNAAPAQETAPAEQAPSEQAAPAEPEQKPRRKRQSDEQQDNAVPAQETAPTEQAPAEQAAPAEPEQKPRRKRQSDEQQQDNAAPAQETAPTEQAPAEQAAPAEPEQKPRRKRQSDEQQDKAAPAQETAPTEQAPAEKGQDNAAPQPEAEPAPDAGQPPAPDSTPVPDQKAAPADQQAPDQSAPRQPAQGEAAPADENAPPVLDSQKERPAHDRGGRNRDAGQQTGEGAGSAGAEQPAPVDQGPPPADDRAAQQAIQPEKIVPITREEGKRIQRVEDEDISRRRRPEGADVVKKLGDRVIIQFGGQTMVESSERPRMTRGASDVYYEDLPRGRTRETIVRRNGDQVVTIRNRDGDVIQRSRITPDGREYVLNYVDERYYEDVRDWRDPGDELPPMRLTIPRKQYILESESVEDPDEYYEFLEQPPVEKVQRLYSINEVKRSARVRDIARRIDLDTLKFDFGSAEISQSEAEKLQGVAEAMEKLLKKNPGETFLIEGHTDAVGSDTANLALSDRRAEAVAGALTDYFDIPPENLTTQGYGERYLKVDTQEPERENRRVAIRRITPLVAPVASAQ